MSDAPNPTVVPYAQQYGWRKDLDSIEACEEVSECADGCCTFFTPRHNDECIRLAAYIERLESEVERSHDAILALTGTVERLEAERDALLAEHEAWRKCFDCPLMLVADNAMCHTDTDACPYLPMKAAYDNAERVIRGE